MPESAFTISGIRKIDNPTLMKVDQVIKSLMISPLRKADQSPFILDFIGCELIFSHRHYFQRIIS